MLDVFVARLTDVGRNLGEPDCSLDGFDLTEERSDPAEGVMTPVLQQAGSLRGDALVGRIWDLAPTVHLVADTVDDRGVGVLLLLGRQPLSLIKDEVRLFGLALLLPRGRDRLDRHAALKWLSRDWLIALRLPEPLQYFGDASRVETIALRPAVLRSASAAGTRVVRLVAHGSPAEWDLGVSAMRQLAFDLSARGTQVEVALTAGYHNELSDENKYLLASLADHPRVSVVASASALVAGGVVVLAEVVGLDGVIRWATADASAGAFSEKWGRSDEPVITVRQASGSTTAMDRLVVDQIRPATRVAGDVEVVLHREVDGPLLGFGERLWKLLAASHPDLLRLLESAECSVSAIAYSDRYLFSPLSVALLKQLLVGLRMRVGGDRWGRPEIEIATLDCRPGADSRATYLIFHDWNDVRTRNAVLEASIKSVPAVPQVLTSERNTLQHGRALVVKFSNGAIATVRFDQDVSYWRSGAMPSARGENQLRFPFSAGSARQWESLSRLAIPIEGDAHPTEIFVKVRQA